MTTSSDPIITRWLLDVRNLWPGTSIKAAASKYLDLLPPSEQAPILRKLYIHDARLSLGSALLKRAYISQCTGLPWAAIAFSRRLHDRLGKPFWDAASAAAAAGTVMRDKQAWPRVDFNVSHQKGLVLLVGVCQTAHAGPPAEIAVDLVSPNERNDYGAIAESGFAVFMETFGDVFSDAETFALTYSLPQDSQIRLLDGTVLGAEALGRLDRTIHSGETLQVKSTKGETVTFPSDLIIEEKLRNFYAAFCLKEAFVKLGGEGLSAPWLKQCEFHAVRAPSKGAVPRCSLSGVFGEVICNAEGHHARIDITRDGEHVTDVLAETQSYEEDYIFSTMLRPASLLATRKFPDWQMIHLDDVLPLEGP